MTDSQVAEAQSAGQIFVLIRLVSRRLLKHVLATTLGSIVVVQILAHLPMTDLNLP